MGSRVDGEQRCRVLADAFDAKESLHVHEAVARGAFTKAKNVRHLLVVEDANYVRKCQDPFIHYLIGHLLVL
eukprot:817846-Prorocentrum_minimum.AAC.1